MKIAALIFGILAGLFGLPVASYGHVFVAIFGANAGGLFYLLPLASFVGGGVALNYPGASAGLLMLCAVVWLALGGQYGYAINVITIGPLLCNAIGGALALFAALQAEGSMVATQRPPGLPGLQPERPPGRSIEPSDRAKIDFDRTKWNALVKYDADIGRIADKLKLLGDKWVEVFAADYLALNDKAYLPEIVRKIIADAKAEEEEIEHTKIKREEYRRAAQIERDRHLQVQEELRQQRLQNRVQVKERWKARFWSTPIRSLGTNFVIFAIIVASSLAGWSYYKTVSQTYSNVHAYCRALVNTHPDDEDKRWVGEGTPQIVRDQMKSGPSPVAWRCMDGEVYGCFVGASGRACAVKDTSKEPRSDLREWCRQNPNIDFIPMSLSGYSSSSWKCANGVPAIIVTLTVDKRGFFTGSWTKISP